MSQWDFAVNFFVALFALLDPIGNVPVFAAATGGAKSKDRALIALYISLFVLGFLTFFYFTGLSLLEFFGISQPAFRIAGGVILFILGLGMIRDDFTASYAAAADESPASGSRAYARRRFEQMIVPFAMPLLIGPGAMSAVIIYAAEAKEFGLTGAAIGAGVIAAVCVATLVCFLLTPLISRIFGRVGMTIVVRVAGLILCAMAIQFIIIGLNDATRGLFRANVAAPYADSAH